MKVCHFPENPLKASCISLPLPTKCSGELEDYYTEKVAEKHTKMSLLNAIRNKLIHRVFVCVKAARLF